MLILLIEVWIMRRLLKADMLKNPCQDAMFISSPNEIRLYTTNLTKTIVRLEVPDFNSKMNTKIFLN